MHPIAKNAFLLAATVLVAVFGYYVYGRQQTIKGLQAAQQQDRTRTALALQRQCAERADFFKSDGYGDAGMLSSYDDHYNAKLNKCFILVLTMFSGAGQNNTLYEAFEGKQYAEYFSGNSGPGTCTGTIQDSSTAVCSLGDFSKRIDAAYMTD